MVVEYECIMSSFNMSASYHISSLIVLLYVLSVTAVITQSNSTKLYSLIDF